MNKLRHRQYERGVRAALGVIDQYIVACEAQRDSAHRVRTATKAFWADRIAEAATLADRILDLIDPERSGGIHGSESYTQAQKEALDG